MRIILASQSPMRKELLKQMGLEFEVIVSNADESFEEGLSLEEQSKRLAYIKAKTVFDETEGDRVVIGSDTMVIKDNKILLNRLENDDFWTFFGGKVAFGESSEKAIVREYFEETGANIGVERLAALVENFFDFNSKRWHELLFFYVLKDENEELDLFEGERRIRDNSKGIYITIFTPSI